MTNKIDNISDELAETIANKIVEKLNKQINNDESTMIAMGLALVATLSLPYIFHYLSTSR